MWRFRASQTHEDSWQEPVAGRFHAETTRYNAPLHVAAGEVWALEDVTVFGDVTVESGGVLRMQGGTIHGHLACTSDSLVLVDGAQLTGPVLVTPPSAAARNRPEAAIALLNSRVAADVRCVGSASSPATLILGSSTIVHGSVLTAHAETIDHGAAVKVTTWHTESAAEADVVVDLTTLVEFNAHGIAS